MPHKTDFCFTYWLFLAGMLLGFEITTQAQTGINPPDCPANTSILFPQDTVTLCGSTLTLNAANGFSNYQWNTGAITAAVTVNVPGRYFLSAISSSGCLAKDTVMVTYGLKMTTRPLVGCGDDPVLLNNGVVEDVKGKVIEFFADENRTYLLNSSVKISTRYSNHDRFNAAKDYQTYIDGLVSQPPTPGYGDAYLPVYRYVSNNIIFNGPQNDIAYKYTVRFYADRAGLYKFRTSFDFGRGGAVFLDGTNVAFNNQDMWWNGNWNLPGQTMQWSSDLKVGVHEILVYGLESCCDGAGNAEFMPPGGTEYTAFSTLAYVKNVGRYYVTLHDPVSGCERTGSIDVTRRTNPALIVQQPAAVCAPASVDLTLPELTAGNEPGLSFTYYSNAGLTNRVTDPSKIVDSGRYYIVGQSIYGCNSIAQEVLVNIRSSVKAAFEPATKTGCTNKSIQFKNNTVAPAGLQFHWTFGTGNAADSSALASPAFTYTSSGKYPVRLEASAPGGCYSSFVDTVTVFPTPEFNIAGPIGTCINQPVSFSAGGQLSGSTQLLWNFSNGQTALGLNAPDIKYNKAGNYTIELIGRQQSCADTIFRSITVFPSPEIGLNGSTTTICLGNSINIEANGGQEYQWAPAMGLNNSTIANPTASPVSNTLYKVTVKSAQGCIGIDSVLVQVNQPIHLTTPDNLETCAGDPIMITVSGANRYRWLPDASLSNTDIPNPICKPLATTTYQVIGFGAGDCFMDTAVIRVSVQELPRIAVGADTMLQAGQTIQLSTTASADVIRYSWTPAAGLSCTDCPAPFASPVSGTEYTVTVENAAGCRAKDTVMITLNCSTRNVYIPSAFSPNHDGQNDVFYPMGKGIKSIKNLRIFNRWGIQVYERSNFQINDRAAGWNGTLNGEELPSQSFVYYISLLCETGQMVELRGSLLLLR